MKNLHENIPTAKDPNIIQNRDLLEIQEQAGNDASSYGSSVFSHAQADGKFEEHDAAEQEGTLKRTRIYKEMPVPSARRDDGDGEGGDDDYEDDDYEQDDYEADDFETAPGKVVDGTINVEKVSDNQTSKISPSHSKNLKFPV